jgi:hypothetical protein
MARAFVDHFQAEWRKRASKSITDTVDGPHRNRLGRVVGGVNEPARHRCYIRYCLRFLVSGRPDPHNLVP